MSKLVFLADTNIVSLIATLTTWMLVATVWVVALSGLCMSKAREQPPPSPTHTPLHTQAMFGAAVHLTQPFHSGGSMSMPTHGFSSAAVVPLVILIVIPPLYPSFHSTAVRCGANHA